MNGNPNIEGESGENYPKTSLLSAEQSKSSKKRWRSPTNVRDIVNQTTKVMTMLLNNEIDLDKVKVYSALARTAAQAISAEVNMARLRKSALDLEIDPDEALSGTVGGDDDEWDMK